MTTNFEQALNRAKELHAAGHGAEDHTILYAVASKVSELEEILAGLRHAFKNHQDRIIDLVAKTDSAIHEVKTVIGGLRSRVDGNAKQVQHIKHQTRKEGAA